MLEGEQKKVLDLYEKIKKDSRHTCTELLVSQSASDRFFENWSMGYQELEGVSLEVLKSVLSWEKIETAAKGGEKIPENVIVDLFWKFKYRLDS